jgi:hypothetical protein
MLFSPQILSRSQPRVVTASAYVGPGDIVSSAFAWWGLRGYTAAYSTGSNPALDLVDQAGANQLTVNILSGTTTASIAATDATWHAAQAVFNDHVVRRLRGWIVNDRSFCGHQQRFRPCYSNRRRGGLQLFRRSLCRMGPFC